MNKNHLLRVLVAANVLFAFASVGAEGFFGWTLPPVLAEYEHTRFSSFSLLRPGDAVRLLLLAVTVLCAFAAWTALVNYWRFARRLYLVSLALSILLVLASGPSVATSLGTMFRMMDSLVGGAILGLVYYSDLARRFERTSAENAAPAGMTVGTGRA